MRLKNSTGLHQHTPNLSDRNNISILLLCYHIHTSHMYNSERVGKSGAEYEERASGNGQELR
jgi:hypothetical protein